MPEDDPQKNLLALATQLAELQEQTRLSQWKISDIEKRSNTYMRERDQILLENSRASAAKTKLESLCRELHQHNQQIRVGKIKFDFEGRKKTKFNLQDESVQRQQDDETKRRELATKFQVESFD